VLRQLRRWGVADAAAHQAPRRWAALLSARHGAAAAPAADLLVALENSRYASMGSSSNWLARRRWHADFRRAGRMLASKLD
jgi:hypothetical protein